MILGQINFGPSGKFDYSIETDTLKKVSDAVIKFVMQADEKAVVDYLSVTNSAALLRLKKLIEDALNQRTTSRYAKRE